MAAPAGRDTALDVVVDDGTRLHTRTDGGSDAPALLLCNSLGTDHTVWDLQVPAWSSTRRVVRFDQRGHGASDTPPGPYTLDRLGQDAVAVLDAHDITDADVCGISLGGLVGLWVAVHAPDRVRRLVVADTAGRVGTEEGWRERAALVRSRGMGAVTAAVLDRFFSPAFRASGASEVARVEQLLRTTSPEGYAASCEALAIADLTPELGRIRAPAVVVVGADDVATPPSDAAALQAAVPGSRLVELPDAGHLANLEQPERFTEVVTEHLDDPPATSADEQPAASADVPSAAVAATADETPADPASDGGARG